MSDIVYNNQQKKEFQHNTDSLRLNPEQATYQKSRWLDQYWLQTSIHF